jgi:hypothetical protein
MVDLVLLNMEPRLRTHFVFSKRSKSLSKAYELGQQLTNSLVASSQRLGALGDVFLRGDPTVIRKRPITEIMLRESVVGTARRSGTAARNVRGVAEVVARETRKAPCRERERSGALFFSISYAKLRAKPFRSVCPWIPMTFKHLHQPQ